MIIREIIEIKRDLKTLNKVESLLKRATSYISLAKRTKDIEFGKCLLRDIESLLRQAKHWHTGDYQ